MAKITNTGGGDILTVDYRKIVRFPFFMATIVSSDP
jgi:hypothetical protein